MAVQVWSRLKDRIAVRDAGHDDGMRRVAFRLAAQTVGLLLVMIIALELVVYVITQQALLGSLETTLRQRASQPDGTVCQMLRLYCGQPPPGGGHGPPPGGSGSPPHGNRHGFSQGGGPPPNFHYVPNNNPSEASAVYVIPPLHVIHGDGVLGAILLDKNAARRALSTRTDQCCSVETFKGENYLVYTSPLWSRGNVVAAVQTSISEHQYGGTMQYLMRALLLVALLGLLISGAISAVLVRRSLAPIRAAVQRQRDFVADAAHELRTPLAIQRTIGEVAMTAPEPDELQETVVQMLGQNRHLTRLVDDLSLLARADTNAVSIDRASVDLSSLVADTSAELGYLAEEQGVTLDTEVQPNIVVTGDILRLRQLLLILLDNALKHTPQGGTVRVLLTTAHGRVRLQVIDSGPGIAPADLTRIFDRFYQADQARAGQGSGLGLAIGKWIAEAHGGQIQAGNVSPHGAVFTVVLPIARHAALATRAPLEDSSPGAAS